jgi:hypothetical protein
LLAMWTSHCLATSEKLSVTRSNTREI